MSAATTRKIQALVGPVAELAANSIQPHLSSRRAYVKCKSCKDFFPPKDIGIRIHTLECTTCDHTASFCNGCGGKTRTIKSIKLHTQFYIREKSIDWYGKQHEPAWASFKRSARSDRLTIMRGGKK